MRLKYRYRIAPYRLWSKKDNAVITVYELWERTEFGSWSSIRGVPMKTCETTDEVFLYAAAVGIQKDEIEIIDEF